MNKLSKRQFRGRFISTHLAAWSAAFKKEVPVRPVIVNWEEIFASIETGGVKNIFVEMRI